MSVKSWFNSNHITNFAKFIQTHIHRGMSQRRREQFCASICFLLCALLVFIYTLNHFYRTGAYIWDSGEFSYHASFSTTWPMQTLPILHGRPAALFEVHVMPFFYATSALHQILFFIPAGAYFSFLQGLWAGLLGLAVFVACSRSGNLVLTMVAALATAFCGPVLSTIGFPHVEIAIPALLLLFFALRSSGHRAFSYGALGLCLSVREDAGLHAGAVLALLALAQRLSGGSWQSEHENGRTAFICIAYSVSALAFQHFFYPIPVSSLTRVYLGEPMWSHLNSSRIHKEVILFLTDRAYATWPVIFLLAISIWSQNIILAVGPIAVLPWIFLSMTAVHDGPSLFMDYYSFPTIFAIAWPSIAVSRKKTTIYLQVVTSVLSIVLFVLLSGVNHDNAPWRGLALPNFATIGAYERELTNVVTRARGFGKIMVDDAVASLIPERLQTDEWTNQWAFDHLANPDGVVYKEAAWDAANTTRIIQVSGLTQICRIGDTPFFIASHEGASYCE